jgi:outer membrane lipoprotein SlyB
MVKIRRQPVRPALAVLTLVAAASVLAGCASSKSGDVYSRDQARTEQNVRMGTIEATREVRIEGTKSGIGAVAGGVTGGIAASTIGHGTGSAVAAAVGAIAGSLAGAAAEEGLTKSNGVEITVRLDSGQTIAVVQGVDAETTFQAGDRVRVLSGQGITRVSR